jgi:hypothetical protein
MGIARGAAGVVAAALVAGLVGVAAPAGAGGPTTINVTTTADVVDAGDGLTSLREAVDAASGNPAIDEIVLAPGALYDLTACDAGDLNLDHDGPLTVAGNGSTVQQTCNTSDVLVVGRGGVAPGEEVDEHAVVLEGLTFRTTASSPGALVNTDGSVRMVDVHLTGSFGGNAALFSSGPLAVESSSFDGLVASGPGGADPVMNATGGVEIRSSSISGNTAEMAIFGVAVSLEDVEIVGNTFSDATMFLFEHSTLDGVELRDNRAHGGVAYAGGFGPGLADEYLRIQDSVFVGNTIGAEGFGSLGVIAISGVSPVITGTSIAGNTSVAGQSGVIAADVDLLTLSNSTVAGNTSPFASAGVWMDGGSLNLLHTTIVGNAGLTDEESVQAGSMSAVGSVVDGPGDDCSLGGSTGSGGGNVAGDSTCGFDHATDQESVTDLGLEPLDLEASMPVLVPEPSSPLVDAVTAPACGFQLPFDQVGHPRPSGPGCDAGAVELQQPFSDVPLTHTFFSDIGWAAETGIAGGFPDGTYRPGAPVARQAMAAFLYRLAGEPAFDPPAEATFDDVPVTSTFFGEIEWLVAEGIAGGFADGTFRPGQAVARQAMAAFLYRFEGEPAFTPPGVPSFSDVLAGSTFFHEVEWLTDVGIADGFADGTFRPGQAVTRQAMAAFLHRLADL